MKLLEERIKKDGVVLPGNVLKVNQFLNHQIDPELMYKMGEEFARLFKDEEITKIITVESSGIAPAVMAGLVMKLPVVFARKHKSLTLVDNLYTSDVYSYTKKVTNTISVDKKFLTSDDKVLIIDDFLANGEAAQGGVRLIEEAGATIEGIGIVIEKSFQVGRGKLEDKGYDVYSLARISKLGKDLIEFID